MVFSDKKVGSEILNDVSKIKFQTLLIQRLLFLLQVEVGSNIRNPYSEFRHATL